MTTPTLPALDRSTGLPAVTGPHVTFGHLWLTDATDLTRSVRLKFLSGSTAGWPSGATTGVLGKGRVRASRGPRPQAKSWTPQLGLMPVETAHFLEDVAGDPYWARDPLGNKICCIWSEAPIVWRGREAMDSAQMAAVTLTLLQFSHAEA